MNLTGHLLLLLALTFSVCVSAQDISGTWYVSMEGAPFPEPLVGSFEIDQASNPGGITGSGELHSQPGEGCTMTSGPLAGTIGVTVVDFLFPESSGSEARFQGTASSSEMSGTWVASVSSSFNGTWTASREPPPIPVPPVELIVNGSFEIGNALASSDDPPSAGDNLPPGWDSFAIDPGNAALWDGLTVPHIYDGVFPLPFRSLDCGNVYSEVDPEGSQGAQQVVLSQVIGGKPAAKGFERPLILQFQWGGAALNRAALEVRVEGDGQPSYREEFVGTGGQQRVTRSLPGPYDCAHDVEVTVIFKLNTQDGDPFNFIQIDGVSLTQSTDACPIPPTPVPVLSSFGLFLLSLLGGLAGYLVLAGRHQG